MAWQDTLVRMLRVIVNDNSGELLYTDTRLLQTLVVAAHYVQTEVPFDTAYTIDIMTNDITPTPLTDVGFANLVVLKAACLLDVGQYRTKIIIAGLSAKCGPVSLDTGGHLAGFKELLTLGPCAAYEALKRDVALGNAQACAAILSPFISNVFDPDSLYEPGHVDRGVII